MFKILKKMYFTRCYGRTQFHKKANRPYLHLQMLGQRINPNTYTVSNNLDDSNPGSLRRAIEDANANSGIDTIEWDGPHTSILTSALKALTGDVVFVGKDKADCIVSGNNLFKILSSTKANISISITNLTLQDGAATFVTPTNGGAIYMGNGGTLTITNSIIQDSSAGRDGGAIYIEKGTGSSAKVSLQDSTINNTRAFDDEGGGAIFANGGDVIVKNSTISKCTASLGNGGAIHVIGGSVTISDGSVIRDCIAQGNGFNGGHGGGVAIAGSSTVTITTTAVSDNTCNDDGGGVVVLSVNASVAIVSSELSENTAGGFGGGISYPNNVVHDTTYNIRNSTIAKNTADRGGGVFVDMDSGDSDLKIYNSTIAENSATESSGSDNGGGIRFSNYTSGDSLTLTSTIVAHNDANGSSKVGEDIGGSGVIIANYSLIRITGNDDNNWTFTGSSKNIIGTTSSPQTAGFAAGLANNGGPTRTYALTLLTSPALHTGSNSLSLSNDQRDAGYQRQWGPGVDIGAYEAPYDDGNKFGERTANSGSIVVCKRLPLKDWSLSCAYTEYNSAMHLHLSSYWSLLPSSPF